MNLNIRIICVLNQILVQSLLNICIPIFFLFHSSLNHYSFYLQIEFNLSIAKCSNRTKKTN